MEKFGLLLCALVVSAFVLIIAGVTLTIAWAIVSAILSMF